MIYRYRFASSSGATFFKRFLPVAFFLDDVLLILRNPEDRLKVDRETEKGLAGILAIA
jgi:hypothetical protein